MTLTIELSPEAEAHLKAEAIRRNKTPEEYARTVLEQHLPLDEPAVSAEARLQAFRSLVAAFRDLKLPTLPERSYTREFFYEDERP